VGASARAPAEHIRQRALAAARERVRHRGAPARLRVDQAALLHAHAMQYCRPPRPMREVRGALASPSAAAAPGGWLPGSLPGPRAWGSRTRAWAAGLGRTRCPAGSPPAGATQSGPALHAPAAPADLACMLRPHCWWRPRQRALSRSSESSPASMSGCCRPGAALSPPCAASRYSPTTAATRSATAASPEHSARRVKHQCCLQAWRQSCTCGASGPRDNV